MNILVINWQDIKNPFGGGAEVHFHEIFKRIVAKGHQVDLLACEIDGQPKYEVIDGINIYRKGSRSLFNYYVKSSYLELSSKTNYDIVIDDVNKIPFYTPLFVTEPLLGISHHFFGSSIFREANFIAGMYVYISEYLMNFVYKKTPFAVVSQSTLDEFMHKGFDKNKFSIVPNAIEPNEYPMKVTEKHDKLTITYFGRIKKYKSIDHLFHAFAKVQQLYPDSRLQILGKGDYQPMLEQLSKDLKIDDKVKFFGFVTNETKIEELSKSHLVVNTSMKEGWGITNIEANACGTPVISANVPGLRDSVHKDVSGKLYEYGDIDGLTDIIIDLIMDNKKRQLLEEGAVEWAKSFSWEESANLMLQTIQNVIDRKL